MINNSINITTPTPAKRYDVFIPLFCKCFSVVRKAFVFTNMGVEPFISFCCKVSSFSIERFVAVYQEVPFDDRKVLTLPVNI